MTSPTYDEPAFVCVYGPSGWGKTSEVIYTFPDALFIAASGALAPWTWIGVPYKPYAVRTSTIMDVTELLKKYKEGKYVVRSKTRGTLQFSAIVCDDFSLVSDTTFAVIDKKYTASQARPMWGEVREVLIEFRAIAREVGVHVVLTCHERGPHTHEKKGYVRGGPSLPGTMPEDLPKSCDMVLRVQPEPSWPVWGMAYSANEQTEDYVEKDRYRFVPSTLKRAPMNLGELLRRGFGDGSGVCGTSKFPIRRATGLEWMDQVVEKIATRLGTLPPGSDESKAVLAAFAPLVQKKYNADPKLINWCFRDALARAWLRTAHAAESSPYTR